jgi:hypothetical protein
VRVMPGLAVKLRTMFGRMLAAAWIRSVITFTEVEVMVDVSVEMLRPMEPWPCSDKNASIEPLRTIVAIGSAVIGRNFIVSVRAGRWSSYTDRNLGRSFVSGSDEQTRRKRHQTKMPEYFHKTSFHWYDHMKDPALLVPK